MRFVSSLKRNHQNNMLIMDTYYIIRWQQNRSQQIWFVDIEHSRYCTLIIKLNFKYTILMLCDFKRKSCHDKIILTLLIRKGPLGPSIEKVIMKKTRWVVFLLSYVTFLNLSLWISYAPFISHDFFLISTVINFENVDWPPRKTLYE